MPAYANKRNMVRPRERVTAFAAVVLVQAALAFILLNGLRVDVPRSAEAVQRLIKIALAKPPPPPVPPAARPRKAQQERAAAPKSKPDKLGGSPGPKPSHAPPSVPPVVAVSPTVAPSGGGAGQGPAIGGGAGGGAGGYGYGGGGGGGTELVQIAGEITPRDYPRRLRESGVGGIVGLSFRVEPTGLVSRCRVTRSSGVPELDALTCRLIVQRFRYRPSTDRYGRPMADTVDGEHEWIPHR
jgi:protein TonB